MKPVFLIAIVMLTGCALNGSTEDSRITTQEHTSDIETVSEPQAENWVTEESDFAHHSNSERIGIHRLEIPREDERQNLPSCKDNLFSTFPVDMDTVTGITPLGNLGPPGHTFPTDHPHIHLGEYQSGIQVDLLAPSDAYLTFVSWDEGQTQDPVDFVLYFAVCKDVIFYYNHVKQLSDQLQEILKDYTCEEFSTDSSCAKVIDLVKIKEGTLIGTVGHKQGNFDFGLIDLNKPLQFIKPERYPERTRYIQCPFDYYPDQIRDAFYSYIIRDDKSCSTTMQDLPGTLRGNWFHETAGNSEVDWNLHLSFANDYEFSDVQVVSVAGIFTTPGKFEFRPKNTANINRNFAHVKPGDVFCYQSEVIRSFQPGSDGKIILQMIDNQTLHIHHKQGECTQKEILTTYAVYKR